MGLIDEITNCFSQNELPSCPSFRAVLIGEGAGYFENIKNIVSFSSEQIVLSLRNGTLKVSGSNLYIKKYCSVDVVICGKIRAIEKV